MVGYCNLLEKSGKSELNLIEGGERIDDTVTKRTIDKVTEVAKRLADASSYRPWILAIPFDYFMAFPELTNDSGSTSYLDIRHVSYEGFDTIECHGQDLEEDRAEGVVVSDGVFEICPKYCKGCQFYEERDKVQD